jgi:Nucleotide hydrolase
VCCLASTDSKNNMKSTACEDHVKQSSWYLSPFINIPTYGNEVHEHNHPHVLMLQIANAFFKLPGDYLFPHEEELPGFRARLAERLSPPEGTSLSQDDDDETEAPDEWNVYDCVAQWWRPNFETFMYPFIPAHVTRPKECKKMYLIQLPKKSTPPPSPKCHIPGADVSGRAVVCTEEYETPRCTAI